MLGERSQLCKNISIIKFYTSRKNLEKVLVHIYRLLGVSINTCSTEGDMVSQTNEKQINKQPKIKQTNIRAHT